MRDTATHWRDSARNPRFYIIDAYACFPFLLLFLHIRKWTFLLALLSTIFFILLERFGFTVPVFLRWIRATLVGKYRSAIPWWATRIKE